MTYKPTAFQWPGWGRAQSGVNYCHVADVGGSPDAVGDWFWNIDDGNLPVGPFASKADALANAERALDNYYNVMLPVTRGLQRLMVRKASAS